MNQVYELTHETAGGIKGERESQRETCAEVRARAARGPAYFLILDSAGAPGKKKKFEDAANPGSDSGGTRSGGVSEVSADPPGLPWSLSLNYRTAAEAAAPSENRTRVGVGSIQSCRPLPCMSHSQNHSCMCSVPNRGLCLSIGDCAGHPGSLLWYSNTPRQTRSPTQSIRNSALIRT